MALQRPNHRVIFPERVKRVHHAVKVAGELGYQRILKEMKK